MDKELKLEEGKDYFVYLAGKVSGLTPKQYHTKFENCREWLSTKIPSNYQIITPTDLCEDDWNWNTCMEVCVNALKRCIAVYFMPDWRDSKGATCERYISEALGLRIIDIDMDSEANYYFPNQIDGFTNLSGSIEYSPGDIVVIDDGSILDYQGVIGESTVLYTFLLDKEYYHEYYGQSIISFRHILRLSTEKEKETYNLFRKTNVKNT